MGQDCVKVCPKFPAAAKIENRGELFGLFIILRDINPIVVRLKIVYIVFGFYFYGKLLAGPVFCVIFAFCYFRKNWLKSDI